MKKFKKYIFILSLISLFLIIGNKVYAAGMGVSINKSKAEPGESFSVTISGIYGSVNVSANSNVSLNSSGTIFVDGSTTITGTAKSEGSGKINVNVIDAVTNGAEPQEVSGSQSVSLEIKMPVKEETKVEAPVQNNSSQETNTKKETKKNEKTKTEQKKEEVIIAKDEETAMPQFGLNGIIIKGIRSISNGQGEYHDEEIELSFTPTFNIDTYEYICNVDKSIKKIKIYHDAGIYYEFVKVDEETELKEGENIIEISMAKDGEEEKKYNIKVIKEEDLADYSDLTLTKDEHKGKIIMPIPVFIIMQIFIVLVTVLITYLVIKNYNK